MYKYKVLLISSDFRWYAESYKNAFEKNECEVKLISFHTSLYKKQVIRRLLASLGYLNLKDYERKKVHLNNTVLEVNKDFKPNIIYLILCYDLFRETVLELKKNAIIIQNLGDTIELYKNANVNIDLFDLIYSYEWNDIEYLRKKGLKVYPQMGTYDERRYYPIETKKIIDVSFVGKMYKERTKILEKLVIDLPKINFKFYGEYAPLRKPWKYLKWIANKKFRLSFVNRNTDINETNRIYNKSKIVLNIHCAQTKSGWSSRLPEISATESFQIVDFNQSIENEFGHDIVMFKNYEELKSLIEYYLVNDEERMSIAKNVSKHVKNMTIKTSIKKVLGDVELLL